MLRENIAWRIKSHRHILHSFVRRKKLQAFLWERDFYRPLLLFIFCQRWLLTTGAIYSLKRYSLTSSRFFIANFRGNFQHHAIFMILIFSSLLLPPCAERWLALARGSFCTSNFFSLAPSFFPRHSQCRSSSPFIRRIIMLFLLLSSLFLPVLLSLSVIYATFADCVTQNKRENLNVWVQR